MKAVFHIRPGTGSEHSERIYELRDAGYDVVLRTSTYFTKPVSTADVILTDSEEVAVVYESDNAHVIRLWEDEEEEEEWDS